MTFFYKDKMYTSPDASYIKFTDLGIIVRADIWQESAPPRLSEENQSWAISDDDKPIHDVAVANLVVQI